MKRKFLWERGIRMQSLIPIADRIEERWVSHGLRQRLVGCLGIFEDIIYVVLALALFSAALFIVGATLVHLPAHSLTNLIDTLLNRLIVALMLVEILHTVLLFLKTHRFRYQPFLVVGIVAAIRRILVLTAEVTVTRTPHHLSPFLMDLGVTAMVALALTVAIKLGPKPDDP